LNLSGCELDCAGADIFAAPVGSVFGPDHNGVSTHLSGFGLELPINLCFGGSTPACGCHDTDLFMWPLWLAKKESELLRSVGG
jgi:hypothetical protein